MEIIGNGTSISNRSNARTLDWDGNEVLAGGLTLATELNINGTTLSKAQLTSLIALLTSKWTATDTNNDGNVVISLA